jgi:hypothetical protein
MRESQFPAQLSSMDFLYFRCHAVSIVDRIPPLPSNLLGSFSLKIFANHRLDDGRSMIPPDLHHYPRRNDPSHLSLNSNGSPAIEGILITVIHLLEAIVDWQLHLTKLIT